MKVVVGVHGRFHGFDLARELRARDALARLVTTYPKFAVRRFLGPDVPLVTTPWLEAARRVLKGERAALFVHRGFGKALAKALRPGDDLLVGWSGATLEAIEPAHALGLKVVIERGSSHIAHQSHVLEAEYAAWGLPWTPTPRDLIMRELAEYEAADAIAVPCAFAAKTFTDRSVDPAKLIVNPYGVDLTRFAGIRVERPARPKPRVVFVGRVGPRKGLGWLLTAFAPLRNDAELHLIGPHDDGAADLLRRLPTDGVVVRGPLPGAQLAAEYAAADIFCLPSVEEGLALVILQAMAAGLPIVATPETGAEEVLVDGEAGHLVPARDPDALTDALRALIADPDKRHFMGLAARSRVDRGYSWSDYGDRAVAAYRDLLSGETAKP